MPVPKVRPNQRQISFLEEVKQMALNTQIDNLPSKKIDPKTSEDFSLDENLSELETPKKDESSLDLATTSQLEIKTDKCLVLEVLGKAGKADVVPVEEGVHGVVEVRDGVLDVDLAVDGGLALGGVHLPGEGLAGLGVLDLGELALLGGDLADAVEGLEGEARDGVALVQGLELGDDDLLVPWGPELLAGVSSGGGGEGLVGRGPALHGPGGHARCHPCVHLGGLRPAAQGDAEHGGGGGRRRRRCDLCRFGLSRAYLSCVLARQLAKAFCR